MKIKIENKCIAKKFESLEETQIRNQRERFELHRRNMSPSAFVHQALVWQKRCMFQGL